MNDINWGGRVDAASINPISTTLNFKVTLKDTARTPIDLNVPLGPGYTAHHVAAAFAKAWNDKLQRDYPLLSPQYLAVAHQREVRFPKGDLFVAGSKFVDGMLLDEEGKTQKNLPNFLNLKANVSEPD